MCAGFDASVTGGEYNNIPLTAVAGWLKSFLRSSVNSLNKSHQCQRLCQNSDTTRFSVVEFQFFASLLFSEVLTKRIRGHAVQRAVATWSSAHPNVPL